MNFWPLASSGKIDSKFKNHCISIQSIIQPSFYIYKKYILCISPIGNNVLFEILSLVVVKISSKFDSFLIKVINLNVFIVIVSYRDTLRLNVDCGSSRNAPTTRPDPPSSKFARKINDVSRTTRMSIYFRPTTTKR